MKLKGEPKIEDGERDVLVEADRRMDEVLTAWYENHDEARDDINFRDGDQYPDEIKRARKNRPMMVFNQMETYIQQIVGEARQNRFSIQVSPVDTDFGTKERIPSLAGGMDYELAQVYECLIRQIEYASRAEDAYDTAIDHAAGNGFGFFRILTDYAGEESFDKEIRIQRIANPLACAIDLTDPGMVGEGAEFAFVWGWLSKKVFEAKYGIEPSPDRFSHLGVSRARWWDGDKVRIAEYFRKVPTERKIVLLEDLQRIDLGDDKKLWAEHERYIVSQGGKIREDRVIETNKVEWYKLNGTQIVEGPIEFPSKWIPIVMVPGRELNKDGEMKYRSVIRFAKDAQRNYNYRRNTVAERLALGAMAPWVGPASAFKGFENLWREANTVPMGYLPWNDDPKNGAKEPPQRLDPPQMPLGDQADAQASENDLKLTTGIFEAGLGQRSNEKSGVALNRRQRQVQTGTFSFHDNLAKAVAHGARIITDMIPRVYDSERVLRIRNPKGETDLVKINVEDPYTGQKLYDIGAAKYDIILKAGGNYATQREEFVDVMGQVISGNKEALMLIGDVFFANMDHPGALEVSKRFRAMLPPQVRAAEKAEAEGKDPETAQIITPEMVQQAVQQAVEGKEMKIRELEAAIKMKDSGTKRYDAQTKRLALAEKTLEEPGIDGDLREQVAELIAEFFRDMAKQGYMPQAGQQMTQ